MRQRFEQQMTLGTTAIADVTFPLKSRDQLPPTLAALQYIFHCCPTKNQRGSRSRPFFVVWSYHTTNTKDEPKYKFCRTAPIRSDNYIM